MKNRGTARWFVSITLAVALLLLPFDTVKAESVSSEEDFVIEDGVLIKYKGSASEVVIPEGVTEIGGADYANKNGLNYNSTIQKVVLPKTLKEIRGYAFYMCTGLSEIEIPEGVTTIGAMAFEDCRGLTEIIIPESVILIGSHAFGFCDNLSEVNILGEETIISAKSSFLGTPWLEKKEAENDLVIINHVLISAKNAKGEVTVPEGVTQIASEGMTSKVVKVNLPESLEEIGDWAFSSCGHLEEVHMKNRVVKIGDGAFERCKQLKEVEIPKSVREIGDDLLFGTKERTTFLVYQDSVAHNYMKENNLKYRVLDADSEDERYSIVKVQKGDSLWKIAREHLGSGLRYKEIMKLNNLKNTVIYVGQELKVPVK